MSGNRQHILPKFLLKGFASRIEGKKIYTWVYPRHQMPFEADIKKVGVEKYFYGKGEESRVDADITKLENEYAPLLDELRKCSGQIETFDQRVPKLIIHLAIRTKHIRESLRESSEFMIDKISGHLSDFDNLRKAILSKPGIMEFKKTLKICRLHGLSDENLKN